ESASLGRALRLRAVRRAPTPRDAARRRHSRRVRRAAGPFRVKLGLDAKHRLAAGGLLVLGLAQMSGDLTGLAPLKAIAPATAASPAPKVFSAVRGLETYSTRFFVQWTDADGSNRFYEITPERYARLRGPYNRRNVYGAALAYGPVLAVQ